MSAENKKVVSLRDAADARLVVHLSVEELRRIISEEIKKLSGNGADEWFDTERAAEFLGVSTEWIYRNRKRLPFARKVGRKMVRFSVAGMRKWMESGRT
jgi:predicted DNA-binding transcriptional regulator AlpA